MSRFYNLVISQANWQPSDFLVVSNFQKRLDLEPTPCVILFTAICPWFANQSVCCYNGFNQWEEKGSIWKGLVNHMKHNLLEKLGVSIPQLGLGCMRLPTDNDTIDYAHAQKIVDYAMKNGVNYFDTAYMYHNGESQYFLAKPLPNTPGKAIF